MSWHALVAIAVVCLTFEASLILVLGHLKAMRATTGEIAVLKGLADGNWSSASKRMDELAERLQRIDTRTQR